MLSSMILQCSTYNNKSFKTRTENLMDIHLYWSKQDYTDKEMSLKHRLRWESLFIKIANYSKDTETAGGHQKQMIYI